MNEQNGLGDPQKAAPCGDNGAAVATSIVTTYSPGETITVTIDEMIFHPGHYRISLAENADQLPDEPIVTPDNNSPCGSAPIDPAPVYPVLADGVFEHTQALDGPQSIDITLPDDVTCTNCVLQVIQFMSDHALNNPGGCYYHHCAEIALDADSGSDTGSGGGDDTSDSGGPGSDGPSSDETAGDAADGDSGAETSASNPDDGGAADNGGTADGGGPTGGVATGTGATAANEDDSDSGCSCSARGGSNPGSGPLLGLLALAGLGVRRRRVAA